MATNTGKVFQDFSLELLEKIFERNKFPLSISQDDIEKRMHYISYLDTKEYESLQLNVEEMGLLLATDVEKVAYKIELITLKRKRSDNISACDDDSGEPPRKKVKLTTEEIAEENFDFDKGKLISFLHDILPSQSARITNAAFNAQSKKPLDIYKEILSLIDEKAIAEVEKSEEVYFVVYTLKNLYREINLNEIINSTRVKRPGRINIDDLKSLLFEKYSIKKRQFERNTIRSFLNIPDITPFISIDDNEDSDSDSEGDENDRFVRNYKHIYLRREDNKSLKKRDKNDRKLFEKFMERTSDIRIERKERKKIEKKLRKHGKELQQLERDNDRFIVILSYQNSEYKFKVRKSTLVKSIIKSLCKMLNKSIGTMSLIFNGKQLNPNGSMESIGISDGDVINTADIIQS